MGRCRVVKKRRKDSRNASQPSPLSAGLLRRSTLAVCECQSLTVRLDATGRYFTCAYCLRVREHPYFDRLYLLDGHAFCDRCGRWMRIENYRTFATEEEYDAAREEALRAARAARRKPT